MNLFDYTGVIHLHSSYSHDGHVPMAQIVSAANSNGIDFLMLTDHDHLQARQEGWEGWKGKTLIIVGEEIAPRFNHYLAFDISEPILCQDDPEGKNPQKYIDAVAQQGGFGIIAHPDHEGTAMFHVKHYCWNNWTVHGYSAMSVWDFMTDWQNSLRGYCSGLLSFLFPAFFLKGPRRVTLERWDTLNQIRKTVGIGELDNHASIKKILKINFIAFPFARAFNFIRTHILTEKEFTGDSLADTRMVYNSLLHGRCYFALEYFRKSQGFQFYIEHHHDTFFMGDSFRLTHNARLSVHLPRKSYVKIIRNGNTVLESYSSSLCTSLDKAGVYRVEAYFKSFGMQRPWIFSNPIFLT